MWEMHDSVNMKENEKKEWEGRDDTKNKQNGGSRRGIT